jgi:hypothetical protein
MLKHLMNGSSLISIMLRDADDEGGSPTAAELRNKQREELVKNNTVNASGEKIEKPEADKEEAKGEEEGEEDEEDDESEEGEVEEKEGEQEEETEEQKKEREAKEKIEAKAQRKQDRMQRRIDAATAKAREAEAEIVRLKAVIEANPDQKLTAEEVEKLAEEKAAKKLAEAKITEINNEFQKLCDTLQKDANKLDKEFDDKINDIASQFGPLPSFMIGALGDLDNGAEVFTVIADDEELAEKLYGLVGKPSKLVKELVTISTKLLDAKKPKPKKLSAVPDPVTPVKGGRTVSNTITEADTKNMESYVAKRQRQMMEKRKLNGF